MVSGTKFILRALKPSMRDHWLAKSSSLIQQAKTMICNQMTKRYRSVSEPVELTRGLNFSLSRLHGLRRERNGFRRKTKRPSSSGAMRAMSPGSMEMVRGFPCLIVVFSFCMPFWQCSTHFFQLVIFFIFYLLCQCCSLITVI